MYIVHHAVRRLLQETASNSSSSSNSSQFDPTSFDVNNRFSPSMAIILVVLLSSFFFMAFFSVYVRRCSSDDEFNNAGAAPALRPPPEQGVDAAFLQSLPLVTYSAAKKKGSNVECVVCLTDFEENEPLRQLPKCKHVFHPECIDMWLFSHTTCPLCRRSLISDGSRSFRWGGSGSLRLSLVGSGSGRRSAAGPSTPTDIETGGHRNPGGVTTVINENLNGTDCSVHGRDQRLQALPRSHSTGHSLLKRALSRAIFRPSTENSLSNFIGGDSEEPPYGGGCVSITPPPLQRSRSVAAMEVEEAEVAPQPSNSSWMRRQGSWSLSLKRALSLNKLKLSPLQREALSAPVGHAAVSTSGRSTFERLTEV